MADQIGTVRVELVADPSGIKRGIEDAGSSLTRFAAIGATIGNLVADAFVRLAGVVKDKLGEVVDVTSDLFKELSIEGQRAAGLVANSFDKFAESSNTLLATVADRVLPGFAALVERLAAITEGSGASKIAVEGLVAGLKLVVSVAAAASGAIEVIISQIGVLASVAMHVARGEWQEAWEVFKRGPQEAARITRETAQIIADTWNETAITAERAGPMVLGPWITLVHKSEELQQRMRLLRDEATAALADRTKTETEIIAAAQVAYQEQAINVVRFEEIKRQAYLRTQEAMLGAVGTVGRALTAVFDKSKPAAIAQALINTFVGITQALSSLPPPWSFVQAAAVAAMGFAQVRNITSTSSSGGGAPASASAPAGAAPVPTQMLTVQGLSGEGLVSMMSVRSLAEQLIQFQRDGGQVVLA
jgi:hypothetical protein